MRSNRRNPIRVLGRAVLLVLLGVGAYAGLEGADQLLVSLRAPAGDAPGVLPPIEPPPTSSGDRSGAGWLVRAIERTEQRASVAVDVVQTGWIDGELVETHGVYRRVGTGAARRFSQRMQGSVAGRPARISRVSNSRFLFTDLRWGDAADDEERLVTRVDLRRLRREFGENGPALEAGSAAALEPSAAGAMRWGGVATLLASLNRSFDFGAAREMQLRGERVAAMVGRWNPRRLAELLGEDRASIPRRAPHHVVVALSKESLFPLLVEYRAADDPMAAAGLADESLLRPSGRPMLKIDFLRPAFDAAIPDAEFAYAAPAGVPLRDETERELRIARDNRGTRLAATSDAESR